MKMIDCNAPWSCTACNRDDCPGSDGDGWRGVCCDICKKDKIETNCGDCPCFRCDNETCADCAHDWEA